MPTDLHATARALYHTDYVRWVETTLAQLKAGDYSQVDWENLLEEIEEMSRRERQSLESNLIVVLLHLLKWQYQPEERCGSWKGTIREHRRQVLRTLKDSPSLKLYLTEILPECYRNAREQAADETGLPLAQFSTECLYAQESVLNAEFLPE